MATQGRRVWEGGKIRLSDTGNQNFNKRTFSSQASNFYSYFDYENVYYCGAGSFPCGSVAGTPGYMCSKQIIKANLQ